jgi:hypothetical protein
MPRRMRRLIPYLSRSAYGTGRTLPDLNANDRAVEHRSPRPVFNRSSQQNPRKGSCANRNPAEA